MKRIITFFDRKSTKTLVLTPYFFAALCMVFFGPVERFGGFAQLYLFSLTFFFWGLAGIPMIVRGEAQPFWERGGWAVSLGIFHLIAGWWLAFYPLIYNLFFRNR